MKMEPTVTKFSNPEQQNIVIETTNNSGHEPGVSLNVAPRPDLENYLLEDVERAALQAISSRWSFR
jgi:hypothetical protein